MDSSSLSKPPPCTVRPLRCAVFTRTSREGEVDPAFGSTTAQQEACFGYIASHHHMSWLPASVSYDAPGLTGATLERPALQRMLADIEALSAKPRVVRGLGQLGIALSEFKVEVLAEEQGFEPWIRLTVYRISSPAHSTTLPSLRYRTGSIISMGSLFKIILLLLAMPVCTAARLSVITVARPAAHRPR